MQGKKVVEESDSLSAALKHWREQGRWLRVPEGQQVFAVEHGEPSASADQTLLMLHGFPESSHSYAACLPLLRKRFQRIITFDFIGFGFSDKPQQGFDYALASHARTALEVWRQCGVRGGHIVAHDMGDSVLTELLVQLEQATLTNFDEGFKSVTFTNGGMVLSQAKFRVGQKLLLSPAGKLLSRWAASYPVFRQQIASANGNDKLSETHIRELYQAQYYRASPGLMVKLIAYQKERLQLEQSRWLPVIARTQLPLHLSWGLDDRVNPVAIAHYIKAQINPAVELSLVPGLGHFGQIQDPAAWCKPLLAYWQALRS